MSAATRLGRAPETSYPEVSALLLAATRPGTRPAPEQWARWDRVRWRWPSWSAYRRRPYDQTRDDVSPSAEGSGGRDKAPAPSGPSPGGGGSAPRLRPGECAPGVDLTRDDPLADPRWRR